MPTVAPARLAVVAHRFTIFGGVPTAAAREAESVVVELLSGPGA